MKNLFAAIAISVASIAGAHAATVQLNNQASPLQANLGSAFAPQSESYSFFYNDGGLVSFKFISDNPDDATTSITLLKDGVTTMFQDIVLSLGNTFSFSLAEGNYTLKLGSQNDGTMDSFQISAVPLPGAALMFGSALLGAGALRRRKAKEAAGGIAAA